MKKIASVLSLFLALALWGCSSGGSSTASTTTTGGTTTGDTTGGTVEVAALSVAGKVSVVEANTQLSSLVSSPVKPLKLGIASIDPSAFSADSDYNQDQTNIWIHERSAEAFNTVNEILCSIKQSKYDEMLNQGAYKAQIDVKQCSSSNDSASNAGQESQDQSSSSTMPEYELWTVDSSRVDNNSPHIVKVWVHEEASQYDPAKLIMVKAAITNGVSADNPYGLFTMDFIGYPVFNGSVDTTHTFFKGILEAEKDASGKVVLSFVIDGGFDQNDDGTNDFGFSQKAAFSRAGEGTSGGGTVYHNDTHPGQSGSPETEEAKFDFAFDASSFLRADALNTSNPPVCLDRTSFNETAWRYGLYNSVGGRVNINSGFPIKYNDGTKDYFGWVGYWGLWLPGDVSIADGATVHRMEYGPGEGTATPYTYHVVGGKLKKHTQATLELKDIKNVPLDYGDCDQTGCTNYRAIWNGTAFAKTGIMNQTTFSWDAASGNLDLSALNWTNLNFWAQSLGGNAQVALTGCTQSQTPPYTWDCSGKAADTTPVIFYKEDIVYPGDTNLTDLNCLNNCPNPATINNDNPSDDYFNTWNLMMQSVAPALSNTIDYTFNTSTMALMYNGTAVFKTASAGQNDFGVWTGPLFVKTSSDAATALACQTWDPQTQTQVSGTCGWQAWSGLSVFYTWETGANNWNKLTYLTDSSGAIVEFSPPIQVKYVHAQTVSTEPDYKYNGVTFYLEYSGFGNLWGIPGNCVDPDSGETIQCGPNTRWIPEFSIPTGANAANGADSATEYVIKVLEGEQRMKVIAGGCTSLTTTAYTLPDIASWVDPAIGTEPSITDAPAVIGGVVQ